MTEVDPLDLVKEWKRRKERNKFLTMFPREMYPKHWEFFDAGGFHKERLFMAGNRIGKTTAALCEVVMHLTGEYPADWKGHRFDSSNKWWLVGKSSELVRQTLQLMMLGPVGEFGTGLVPADKLDFESLTDAKKASSPIPTFQVKHVSGGWSSVEFKSFEAGRAAFQGTERSVLIDEECPEDVAIECQLRTMTGNNLMILTFTPLMGTTPLIQNFYGELPIGSSGEVSADRYAVNATWDDAPHLSESEKKRLYDGLPPHQREARMKGLPSLGSGAIYPVPESTYVIQPFEIPKHWKRVYGLDVGWNRTAAVWAAIDPETDVKYLYSEHYVGEAEPSVHAASIRSRGDWIPGIIDTAARGRSQVDGKKLFDMYEDLGLDLNNAKKAVEAGLYKCWEELSQGKVKVFANLQNFLAEIRLYQRDEKGHVVKQKDHLMDAFRYLIMGYEDVAKTELQAKSGVNSIDLSVVSSQYQSWNSK